MPDKKVQYLLILSAILVAGAMVLFVLNPEQNSLTSIRDRLEKKLHQLEASFDERSSDRELISDLMENDFSGEGYKKIKNDPIHYLLFVDGELLVWNSTIVVPYGSISTYQESAFVKLQNGFYELLKVKYDSFPGAKDVELVGLIPVRKEYVVQNKYLQSGFDALYNVPDYIEMSNLEVPAGMEIYNSRGIKLFYIYIDEVKKSVYSDPIRILISCIWLIVIAFWLYSLSNWLTDKKGPVVAFGILAFCLITLRTVSLVFDLPDAFQEFDLFGPHYYASSAINKSLGDLLINILIVVWLVRFFVRRIRLELPQSVTGTKAGLAWGIGAFIIYLLTYIVARIFYSFVIDSKISLEINNFTRLDIYSFLAFLGLALVSVGYILLVSEINRIVRQRDLPWKQKTFPAIIAWILMGVIIAIWHGFTCISGGVLVLAFLHWTILQMMPESQKRPAFRFVIFQVIWFAVFTSFMLNAYNSERELRDRELLAKKLASDRDPVTEYLFQDIEDRIKSDQFIKYYYINPYIPTQEIVDRIKYLYFGGYFNRYDFRIYPLNSEGYFMKGIGKPGLDYLDDESYAKSEPTTGEFLFFIPKPNGSYVYLANIPVEKEQKFLGQLLIELTPKVYTKTNLYPELLIEDKLKTPEDAQYNYGIYFKDILIKQEGDYPYDYYQSIGEGGSDRYMYYAASKFTHLVYNHNDDKTVIVTRKRSSVIDFMSLISYLLCIALVLVVIYLGLSYLNNTAWRARIQSEGFNLSLKQRIQFSMLFIIILSFVAIGVLTINYFSDQYEAYHKERLIRKEKAVVSAIQYLMNESNQDGTPNFSNGYFFQNELPINIVSLSDIHTMDINIYDLDGNMILASQPGIFEKGLLSYKMHPEAFYMLTREHKSQYIQNEHIGGLDYLSIYVPIRNREGQQTAYLNLPYFAKERNVREEISSLLVTLVNVYVFLLVLGAGLAFFISRSITQSLSEIREKLSSIRLGGKNKPLEWKQKDEIGDLVNEYNKVIRELDKSARLLAKSERESAWREMAKQVAHEIKNPLTPMKLSIQLLQRATEEDSPKAKEMSRKVTQTLIEQIDNLSHIASEFSSFAKMPRPQNEVLDLNEVVQSVVELFNKDEDLVIDLQIDGPAPVYADKNQLLRVFTNLVKNAKQAIPDEREGMIRVAIERQNGDVRVSVSDNGSGIALDKRDKVFEPNFTTKSSGTGLGLAMSRQMVENALGKIWFESEEDEGTTFYVEIPLHEID